jgi:ribosome biogenesis GTPase
VLPRQSLLYRQDAWKTKAFAANLDQLLVVVAAEPVFSESQLARALIAAEAAHIPSRIVLNKRDLPSWDAAAARLAPYAGIGVEVIGVALKKEARGRARLLAPLLEAAPRSSSARAARARARSSTCSFPTPGRRSARSRGPSQRPAHDDRDPVVLDRRRAPSASSIPRASRNSACATSHRTISPA